MRLAIFLAATLYAQDPYPALRARDYDASIPQFLTAIAAAPRNAALRKDLAYTYLKIGEPTLARDQFHQALTLDPADTTAALEFAFLAYETHQQAEARRTRSRSGTWAGTGAPGRSRKPRRVSVTASTPGTSCTAATIGLA